MSWVGVRGEVKVECEGWVRKRDVCVCVATDPACLLSGLTPNHTGHSSVESNGFTKPSTSAIYL